ncbi:MAG: gas vesicle protein GvpO [Atribacterota bacterium]
MIKGEKIRMNASEIMKKAWEDFIKLTKVPVERAIGLVETKEGWTVTLEGLERRAIPDTMDVLGIYDVRVDKEGNLVGFERKRLRKRGETEGE